MLTRLNILIGTFLFRWRNILFPVLMVLCFVIFRPQYIFNSALVTIMLVFTGVVMILAGEWIRFLTIGYEYIERGGKNKQIYASRLVTGGIYAHSRNPMYVGNILIAVGFAVLTTSLPAYVIIIPFFVFVYQSIVAAEEDYLSKQFGDEFKQYCATVNRYIPSVTGFRHLLTEAHYDWKRALRKDFGTCAGIAVGLAVMEIWREYFSEGSHVIRRELPYEIMGFLAIAVTYAVVLYLKKSKRLG
jgi:protein-S-isoprenylcysteine O-methyltransferase Ste14